MKTRDFNEMSAKEVIEHLMVGYTKQDIIQTCDEIQDEWDRMSGAKWYKKYLGEKSNEKV